MYSRTTYKSTAWSLSGEPIKLKENRLKIENAFNILAVVSADNGVEYYAVVDWYINSNHVVTMLRVIRKKGSNAIVLSDNASYFTSKKSTKMVEKLFEGRLI